MSENSRSSELFKEKNLLQLLKAYEGAFKSPLPAKSYGFWAFVFSSVFLAFLWSRYGVRVSDFQRILDNLVSYGLTVSAALMGVVIAGMSIFAAGLKAKVSQTLIDTDYPGTNLPALKFVFAMFSYVLFSLFLIIASSVFYYIFISDGALLEYVWVSLGFDIDESEFMKFLLLAYFSIFLGLLIFLGSILVSFLWNLYQVLLVVSAFNGRADSD